MKYIIEKSSTTPAYLQIYDQIREDIVNYILPYGSKLPSKRLLSSEIGVSVITIEHAYNILCDEGYIESKERSGYFVIYKDRDLYLPSKEQILHTASRKKTFSNDLSFPFTSIKKAMRKVIINYSDTILQKSTNNGTVELREAISHYLARNRGMSIRPFQIIIGAGAEYLYGIIVQLLGRNRIYAVENPSYKKIKDVYEANGVKCESLNLGNDGILSEELDRTGATVLHVTPFRSFPTGITASASKRSEYINWAEKRSGYIIEDDYDSEFTVLSKAENTVFSMAKNNRVLYINTFSKTIAPSIRVGYMVIPESLIASYNKKLGFYACTVPVFEQFVLAELLNNGDFERHINRVRRFRRKEM